MFIKLVKTRSGCAPDEIEPRYDVMYQDKLFGQLYFNLRGYVGNLPCTPPGSNLSIGEKPIKIYLSAVNKLNKEFEEFFAAKGE